MSKYHDVQSAFFTSLHDYNAARNETDTLKVGLIAAMLGASGLRHIKRFYPECARD